MKDKAFVPCLCGSFVVVGVRIYDCVGRDKSKCRALHDRDERDVVRRANEYAAFERSRKKFKRAYQELGADDPKSLKNKGNF